MPPDLALLIWFALLLALFHFDPAKEPGVSKALWVPLIWLFFIGSRLPSIWLGLSYASSASQALDHGNPLDRAIYLLLTLLAIGILVSRSFQWGRFIAENRALVALIAFAGVSFIWSDFPFATFRKWTRDLGVYMAILVVLSDPRPREAVRTVLRRLAYLLIPLSVVLIKYFPHLSTTYDPWSGQANQAGVTTGKNLLGLLCVLGAVFFLWDTITRWPERREVWGRRIILVNLAFIAMCLWLLKRAHTATGNVCLALGCFMILAAHSGFGRRHPRVLKTLAPAAFVLYLILAVGFGMNGRMAEAVGRHSNLTGRTQIWSVLLRAPINPLLGTGYQSFWLGSRIDWFDQFAGGDNVHEAHNGYLEIYLDLGVVGLFLLITFLIASYRSICKRLDRFTPLASLGLAAWTMLLFYNVTEAAFEGGLLLLTFLLLAIAMPETAEDQEAAFRAVDPGAVERPANAPDWMPARPSAVLKHGTQRGTSCTL